MSQPYSPMNDLGDGLQLALSAMFGLLEDLFLLGVMIGSSYFSRD